MWTPQCNNNKTDVILDQVKRFTWSLNTAVWLAHVEAEKNFKVLYHENAQFICCASSHIIIQFDSLNQACFVFLWTKNAGTPNTYANCLASLSMWK